MPGPDVSYEQNGSFGGGRPGAVAGRRPLGGAGGDTGSSEERKRNEQEESTRLCALLSERNR